VQLPSSKAQTLSGRQPAAQLSTQMVLLCPKPVVHFAKQIASCASKPFAQKTAQEAIYFPTGTQKEHMG
jgi:hypothetical protein